MATKTGESVKAGKLTKSDRKIQRKQVKASRTLLKHDGIDTVSGPTKCLVIANGGLGNGVGREQLLNVLKASGSVESLLMPPGKPYAFVTYTCPEEAARCHATLNGSQLHGHQQAVTLYLCFVKKVGSDLGIALKMPPGLTVQEDFVTLEEERQLLEAVDWTVPNDEDTVQKTLKHRRVKHYGYEFRYDNNNVDKDKPLLGGLPAVCCAVLERCVEEKHISIMPDQLTVNQYQPGQGIPPHVDTHSAFEDTILSLSLGAKTVMDFRHPSGGSIAVVLPGRSLLVMKGESRYLWTHGITPRKFDVVPTGGAEGSEMMKSDPGDLTLSRRGTRTSFTFRKVRHTPCGCAYPSACDSQQTKPVSHSSAAPQLPVGAGAAALLEAHYVHGVYEEIAPHFSSTRHSPWPRVRDFLRALPPAAIVADVGCGNGKYLGINPDLFMVGCDRSCSLVQICADRGFQVLVSDGLGVPLRGGVCDACLSIAVIHHFSTQARRLAAVKELVRLLKPGGKALIYVWAMEQEYNQQKSKYLKEKDLRSHQGPLAHVEQSECGNQCGQPTELSIHTNRTAFKSQDLLVPWHVKGKQSSAEEVELKPAGVCHRYYHVFCEGELDKLCGHVEDVRVESSYYDQGNWCVILQKSPDTV